MDSVALCGTDTLIFNQTVQGGLADGDFANVEYPDDIATMKIGKDGNVIAALNQAGRRAEVTVRYVRGSREDKAMNSLCTQWVTNPAAFTMLTGEYVKKVGDGTSKVASDNTVFSSGVPSRLPGVKGNAEGDADQGVAVYKIKFGRALRIIT